MSSVPSYTSSSGSQSSHLSAPTQNKNQKIKKADEKSTPAELCLTILVISTIVAGFFMIIGIPLLGAGGTLHLNKLVLYSSLPAGLITVSLGLVTLVKIGKKPADPFPAASYKPKKRQSR